MVHDTPSPNKFVEVGSSLILIICILVPRMWNLDHFVTVDEPKWLTRSANFLLAARNGDWASTYQKEHPGVMVMWLGAAGHIWAGHGVLFLNPSYFTKPADLEQFLTARNETALDRLVKARIFMVLSAAAVILLAYLYALRLFHWQAAFLGFLFIALDPFVIAHQRLLHLDGLLSAFLLLCVLAWVSYLHHGRRRLDLVLSAAAAGFGILTKSPALIVVPVVALLGMVSLGLDGRKSVLLRLPQLLRDGLLWLVVMLFVIVAFWPAIWVNPIGTIEEVISGAMGYAGAGHESAIFFNGEIYSDRAMPWYFYPTAYLWRSTPLVLVGLALVGINLLLLRDKTSFDSERRNTGLLFVFAIIYLAVMTLGNKQFDRYILPIFAPLDLAAGLGFWLTFIRIRDASVRDPLSGWRARTLGSIAFFLAVIAGLGVHMYHTASVSPYYFTYYNPVMRAVTPVESVMMIGWGEGLDEAARYLNTVKDANRLRVLSWYPDGSFSFYFDGETNRTDMPADIRDLPNIHYVVLYKHQFQRNLPSSSFLNYFKSIQAEYSVMLNGMEYVEIYRIPDSAYNDQGEFRG